MNAKATARRLGAVTRRLILLPAIGVALTIAFTGAASAQATPFQASVTSTLLRGGGTLPSGACSNGAYSCGTASIAGYGAASWNLYVINNTNVPSSCGSTYAATTYFTLASDPSSTLVLDEGGSLCGLGHDGAAYRGYFAEGSKAYGHPFAIVGSWTVDPASTGQFAGLGGSGTDRVNVAGAHAAGSYNGTLG
jgi:hypothetical protein